MLSSFILGKKNSLTQVQKIVDAYSSLTQCSAINKFPPLFKQIEHINFPMSTSQIKWNGGSFHN